MPTDVLVDRVWGEAAARHGPDALYGYISRLRQVLARVAADITREHGGYRLTADPAAVDVHRFRDLVSRARSLADGEQAAALWAEALSLWRGKAFAEADTPWFNSQRELLDGERMAARLDLADMQLRLGQHCEILPELLALAETCPMNDRVAGQVMLALYRSGRAADALTHYRGVQGRLAKELGIDPGPALQHLHQRMLAADPTLTEPASAVPATAAVHSPVPHQLPAPPAAFTGRSRELAQLDSMLDAEAREGGTVVISAIGGPGGIGKTWLALRWAHDQQMRFPDGQLYADLRGFSPSGKPVSPAVVLRGFLETLCTDPATIPADSDAMAGLFRSLTADKHMLIVLDNARDTAQVAPLLPGSPTCTVVITSRNQLTGLATAHGAQPLTLDVLTDAEARRLLTRRLGPHRIAAEPQAAEALLKHCAGLPLAVSIVAALADTRPDFPLATLAEELHDVGTRLDALDTGDIIADLRAVFSSSYHALDPDTAQTFGLIGLAPGPDISLSAIAALTALPIPRVRALLRRLQAAHLVQEHTPGRYRMHDLIRLYATERGLSRPTAVRRAALHRLMDFYLHTARLADGLLDPHRDVLQLTTPREGVTPEGLADHGAALDWFTAEHPVLLAAVDLAISAGFDTYVWQLAWALETYFDYRGHWHDWAASQQSALETAQRLGDRLAQAGAHRSLGVLNTQMGRLDDGYTHFQRALAIYDHVGDHLGQAHTHRGLGWVCDQQGRRQDALDHNERALRLYQRVGHRTGQAMALNNAGWLHAMLGNYRQTLDYCARAVALNQEIGDQHAEAGAWDSLGFAHHHLAAYDDATDCYERALGLVRRFGDRYNETEILNHLGDTHVAAGRPDTAGPVWRKALEIADEICHPAADELQVKLTALGQGSHDDGP
ncbi:BTAD domain-containing putative transcriptional regulator [Streptomyces sp. NPDC007917]|uniref:AfsR/SARP family transcriptional regulator n=1 Tax=Streptomyces sp. NPDC007917 TaxID=3364793 RepID=UPI0036EFF16D